MITPETYQALGLSDEEYQKILTVLGREPTSTELAMFSVEWSEHCGYMSSRALLKTLPNTGEYPTAVGEDSGAVFVGDYAIVFKVESHNHPSQVEPFQGAATGVGGIIRDIFTANARPIASLNSLRFGNPDDAYTKHLLKEVVRGIAWYGNCIGVPTVGGEVYFDDSYTGNCLVNAMSIGICHKDEMARARAEGVGNSIMYVGNTTGRDGIGGCSVLASHCFDEEEAQRPTVQVGDPFTEKCLIEATLETMKTGHVVGIKDMGAAGLTCSISEMASAGNVGIEAVLDLVPVRERGMEAWEIMMSESQERMLVCVKKGYEDKIKNIFLKWGLHAAVIGSVTDDGQVRISYKGEIVADVSAKALTDAPLYEHEEAFVPVVVSDIREDGVKWGSLNDALLTMLGSPNLSSRNWVYEQYDHMVQTNTVTLPGKSDAAVLRIKGTKMGIATTIDCNSSYCRIHPGMGVELAIIEAAQNIVASGARPIAITNCLNFGDPNDPEAFAELATSIRSMAALCKTLGLPVVSGNVSLYNESPEGRVNPTPTIGMVGVLEDIENAQTLNFKDEGDMIFLIHEDNDPKIGYGEYQKILGVKERDYVPPINTTDHLKLQTLMLKWNEDGMFKSVHDCSEGGIGIAIAEACISGDSRIGANITLPVMFAESHIEMFREAPHRYIVSCHPGTVPELMVRCSRGRVGVACLGQVGGGSLIVRHRDKEIVNLPIERLYNRWRYLL